jgi:hypothetical protein
MKMIRLLLVLLSLAATGACSDLVGPEAGSDGPVGSGTFSDGPVGSGT